MQTRTEKDSLRERNVPFEPAMPTSGLVHIDSPCLPKGLDGRALQQILVAELLCNELF
jgi:hypothetical protein